VDAEIQLSETLSVGRVSWHLDSTARNIRLIRELRTARGEDASWIEPLEAALAAASRGLAPQSA
jgi:hypothetical protein